MAVTKLPFCEETVGGYLSSNCYSHEEGDKNLQGDVVALFDSESKLVATYYYDAWGNVISTTDANGNEITSQTHVAHVNPIRYRSYYYDKDTGFYYLNSRYYDPQVGRFINAEPNVLSGKFDSGAGILAYNAFVYCANNPIMNIDESGEGLGLIIFGVVCGIVYLSYKCYKTEKKLKSYINIANIISLPQDCLNLKLLHTLTVILIARNSDFTDELRKEKYKNDIKQHWKVNNVETYIDECLTDAEQMKKAYEHEYEDIFNTNCSISKEIIYEFAGTYGTLWGTGNGTVRRFVLTVSNKFLKSAADLLSEAWGEIMKRRLLLVLFIMAVTALNFFGCTMAEIKPSHVEISPDELMISNPVWGKFKIEQTIIKKEIETFLLNNGEVFSCINLDSENNLDSFPKNVKVLKYEAYGDLLFGWIYVFESFEITEKYFEDMFKYESIISASKGIYARYYSAVQIGNILAIGGDELIFRLVKEYVPDFERKENTYGKDISIEKYNEEIELDEIIIYMESMGYKTYISSDAGEIYYGFLNLNTNDFCYIVVCEYSESAQKCAERLKGIASYTTCGVSFIYGKEYVFSSRTDVWKNILSEICLTMTINLTE